MEWCRLWHDMPTDPKWRVIARRSGRPITEVIAVYTHMLVTASKAEERGSLAAWEDEDVAAALDMEAEHVETIRQAMEGKVIEEGRLSGWNGRQPKREDAGAADRKRQQRSRDKADESGSSRSVTQCHAASRDVTPEERRGEKRREDKKEGGRAEARGDKPYAFEGHIVRLTWDDLKRWREAYNLVPDIVAELNSADAYYAENPPKDGKWFFPVSKWLEREHKRVAEKQRREREKEDEIYRGVL